MPSNAQLITQAEDLAKSLGLEITTKGLKNEQLLALVSDLKAKKKDADNPAAEEAQAAKAAEEAQAAEEAETLPPYSVAMGKSLTTKRGIKADGEEVFAKDFPGGQAVLDAFVESKHIVKA